MVHNRTTESPAFAVHTANGRAPAHTNQVYSISLVEGHWNGLQADLGCPGEGETFAATSKAALNSSLPTEGHCSSGQAAAGINFADRLRFSRNCDTGLA